MPESAITATDFLVDVGSPEALDETLQAAPGINAFVVGGPKGPFIKDDGHYIVRVFGEPSFFRFMIENQGYCTIVGEREELA